MHTTILFRAVSTSMILPELLPTCYIFLRTYESSQKDDSDSKKLPRFFFFFSISATRDLLFLRRRQSQPPNLRLELRSNCLQFFYFHSTRLQTEFLIQKRCPYFTFSLELVILLRDMFIYIKKNFSW